MSPSFVILPTRHLTSSLAAVCVNPFRVHWSDSVFCNGFILIDLLIHSEITQILQLQFTSLAHCVPRQSLPVMSSKHVTSCSCSCSCSCSPHLLVNSVILQLSNFSNFDSIHHDAIQNLFSVNFSKFSNFLIHESRRSPPCHS